MDDSLPDFSDVLSKYTNEDFATLIPKTMLNISDEEKVSIEYVFWFCHIVERDLADVLTGAIKFINETKGSMSQELSAFVLEKYDLKMGKVDPDQPEFDIKKITFGDRIYFIQQLRGESEYTKFLWEIKNLRDDISHVRIETLYYKGESVLDKKVKAKMLTDYITFMNKADDESNGGFIATMTEEEKKEVEEEFERLKDKLNF